MIRAAFLALLFLASPAFADYLPEGYLKFCARNAALCAPHPGAVATIDQVETVNRSVNARIRYADDQRITVGWTGGSAAPEPIYVVDTWTVDPKRGDCEDYAATKLAALLREGAGRDHIRFALTKVNGRGHIVLLVETEQGWLLLDNLSASLSPSRYRLLAIETPGKAWKAQ
jgi:predicted transglutaminase-like cysteine proteinase